jgi:hypothetical protein
VTDADLVFLPWVRRGAASGVLTPDTFGAAQPGQATATVTLTINAGTTVSVLTTVMGPGHVTGLDDRQVIRTDPAPGSRSFEPNYVPLIELDEPALPWLFTPAAAGAQARLRPWLCLVVVRLADGVRLDPPQAGPLPVLRIGLPARPADELPDLADSWAWAHAQVTAAAGTDLSATLATPSGSLARLLCPRVLTPDTDYLACVVPAFELGRKAGLGQPIAPADEAQLAPAWGLSSSTVELPVYYSWRFATGAGGDFQSLAMLLTARPLPPGIGERPIDVGDSGLANSGVPAHTLFGLAGALRPVGASDPRWQPPGLQSTWESALTPILNAPAAVPVDGDPLLAPPLYGAAAAGLDRIDPSHQARWFEQLNLSPAGRAVAHLGTRVVQQLQDQLMASAWDQAADLERIRQLGRQFEFGARMGVSMHVRHLATMDPGVGLQVLGPAQARMTRVGAPAVNAAFAAALVDTGLDPSVYAVALRRIARPRGAINRRVQIGTTSTTPVPPTSALLARLQPAAVFGRHVVFTAAGPVTLDRVATSINPPPSPFGFADATAAAVAAAEPYLTFEFAALGQAIPPRARIGRRNPVDDTDAATFRTLAQAHLARFNPPRPIAGPPPPMRTGELSFAFTQAMTTTQPSLVFTSALSTAAAAPGVATGPSDRIAPRFPQPMSRPLIDIAQGFMLPGLDLVPPNTVVPLETNTAFVQAYLVGLNTEMGRELLWRGYPADLTATYFDRFWDASSAPGRAPDIDPIASWANRGLGVSTSTEDFVLLIRSELLRRYPDAVIYAVRGTEERQPVFTGAFAPDVRYAGFDIPSTDIATWSIVLMEHPSAPRFGVEVGTDAGTATHRSPVGTNAAAAAQSLRQLPVRITIPATVLLGRP